jgi:hypothetical protein
MFPAMQRLGEHGALTVFVVQHHFKQRAISKKLGLLGEPVIFLQYSLDAGVVVITQR